MKKTIVGVISILFSTYATAQTTNYWGGKLSDFVSGLREAIPTVPGWSITIILHSVLEAFIYLKTLIIKIWFSAFAANREKSCLYSSYTWFGNW